MRLSFSKSSAVLLLLVSVASTATYAWDKEEHRLLADSVFSSVIRECAAAATVGYLMSDSLTFGDQVAQLAANDFDRSRFHSRGQTVLDQLSGLTAEMLSSTGGVTSPAPSGENVIAAFLLSHVRAMRIASETNPPNITDSAALVMALREEALAQGYLADAFAAGHVLSYNELPLSFLQKRNRIEAHDYHRDRGVYVINGRGEVWQTFGDGLLHWYPPTYKAVFDACATSLKEVLVVWRVSRGLELPDSLAAWLRSVDTGKIPEQLVDWWLSEHSGREYYSDIRLPSLMCLPMPVAATWSYRTDEIDEHGVRLRHHYPQLRESGYHDPDLADIDDEFLYSHESVPGWMIPGPLQAASSASAYELIRSDPDWASVRFVQNRHAPPSYKGLLLQAGGQIAIRKDYSRGGISLGLGYGIWDDLLLIKNVSVAATLFPGFCETDHNLLTSTVGLGFDLPGDGWVKALHLEGGVAIGVSENFDDLGPVFALGVDSRVMPLRFTYAGITWRLKYQWFSLDTPVSGPSLEMILQ
jgi:hypothetical protein